MMISCPRQQDLLVNRIIGVFFIVIYTYMLSLNGFVYFKKTFYTAKLILYLGSVFVAKHDLLFHFIPPVSLF